MVIVLLIGHFVTGQLKLISIQYNDKITSINTRRIDSFVLAAQYAGDLGCGATQNFTIKVNNKPFSGHVSFLGYLGTHLVPLYSLYVVNCD